MTPWTEDDLQAAMDAILGPVPEVNPSLPQDEQHVTSVDIEQAYANYVTDGLVTSSDTPTTNSVTTLLKGIQPYVKSLQKTGIDVSQLVTFLLIWSHQRVIIVFKLLTVTPRHHPGSLTNIKSLLMRLHE